MGVLVRLPYRESLSVLGDAARALWQGYPARVLWRVISESYAARRNVRSEPL